PYPGRSASSAPERSRKKLICCVRPGVLLANASRVRFASTLIAVDLPAFDRPANAISGGPGGGNCASFAMDSANSACCKGCFNRRIPEGYSRIRRVLAGRASSVTIRRFARLWTGAARVGRRAAGACGGLRGVAPMKPMLLLAAALGAWPGAIVMAQDAATKADVAKAQTIVNQVCAACHGADGNSPTPVNPSLAGQPAAYIALQLAHFKAGIRTNPVMQGMAATLTPEDMRALGVYFSQQKPKPMSA